MKCDFDINAVSHLRESNRLEVKLAKVTVPAWACPMQLPLLSRHWEVRWIMQFRLNLNAQCSVLT